MSPRLVTGFSSRLKQVTVATPAPGVRLRYVPSPFPDPEHPEGFALDTVSRASLVIIDFRASLDRATLVYDLLILGNPEPAPPCLLLATPATGHWVARCLMRNRDWIVHIPATQEKLQVSMPGPPAHERRRHHRVAWPDVDLYLGEFCDDGPAIAGVRGIDATPQAILVDTPMPFQPGQGVCLRLKADTFWAVGKGVIARSSRGANNLHRHLVSNLKIHEGDPDWFAHLQR